MNRLFTLTFLVSLICTCFLACSENDHTGDKKPAAAKVLDVNKAKISGKWEIVKAFRNGRLTDALDGAFFDFQPEGKLIYNLTGEVQEDYYKVENNSIIQSGTADLVYIVKEFEGQTMVLELNMQGFEFQFTLKRT